MLANLLMSNLEWAIFTLVLGVVVVVVGMLVLVLFVSLAGKMFNKSSKKSNADVDTELDEQVLPVVPAASVADETDIPEHVKVAIIAAIAAYYENNQPQNQFTVRKIKKLR